MLRSIFGWLIIILVTPPWMLLSLILRPIARDLGGTILVAWYPFWAKVFGIKFEVQNKSVEKQVEGPCIYAQLNQTSLLDTFIVKNSFRDFRLVRTLANIEYLMIPFFGWAVWAYGAICVVRQSPTLARRASAKGIQLLKRGFSIGIAVEGRRSFDGELLSYKKGAAVMAIQAQCPIVPVVIVGARSLWPSGTWRIRPGKVILRVLDPIDVRGLQMNDRDELTQKLHHIALAELKRVSG